MADYLTVDGVAELTRRTPHAIRKLVERRLIPYHKHGRRVIFKKSEGSFQISVDSLSKPLVVVGWRCKLGPVGKDDESRLKRQVYADGKEGTYRAICPRMLPVYRTDYGQFHVARDPATCTTFLPP